MAKVRKKQPWAAQTRSCHRLCMRCGRAFQAFRTTAACRWCGAPLPSFITDQERRFRRIASAARAYARDRGHVLGTWEQTDAFFRTAKAVCRMCEADVTIDTHLDAMVLMQGPALAVECRGDDGTKV